MAESEAQNNNPAQPLIVDIKIHWENGAVQMQAPDNILLFRRVMIDAEEVFLQQMMEALAKQSSRIVDPKNPGGPVAVDKRVHQAAKEQRKAL